MLARSKLAGSRGQRTILCAQPPNVFGEQGREKPYLECRAPKKRRPGEERHLRRITGNQTGREERPSSATIDRCANDAPRPARLFEITEGGWGRRQWVAEPCFLPRAQARPDSGMVPVEGSQPVSTYFAKKPRRTKGAMLQLRNEGRAPFKEPRDAAWPGTRRRGVTPGPAGLTCRRHLAVT